MAGFEASVFNTVPRPMSWVETTSTVFWKLLAGATGVTDLVLRGDSMLDGPDWNELMSNAVTA